MNRFIYLFEQGGWLARRWLAAHGAEAPVTLICDAETKPMAEALRAQHPSVTVVHALDAADAAITPSSPPRVVLPVSCDMVPLRYNPPVQMPDVAPLYPVIRRLWRAGFREFELFSLAGSRTLAVPHLLDAFRNRHQGRRCFVVGNGPSLNAIDMTRLKDELTLGANRGYLGFPDWGFAFTYWGVYDPLQIEAYHGEYEAQVPPDIVKFFPFQYLPLLDVANGCPVFMDWPRAAARQFADTPETLYVGYSVVYMLLQIAAVMGCDPIVLVGMDHRYHIPRRNRLSRMVRLAGKWVARHYDHTAWYKAGRAAAREIMKSRATKELPPSRMWQADDAAGPTHFDARYTQERRRFLMPRPEDAERDYACAAQWAAARGVRILNATPDSALTAFPIVAYDSLF